MSVAIGPANSIVIRKDALKRLGLCENSVSDNIGDVVSQDKDLIVFGPLYDTKMAVDALEKLGLEYFGDFFDIPNSGGPVAEWCQIELKMRG